MAAFNEEFETTLSLGRYQYDEDLSTWMVYYFLAISENAMTSDINLYKTVFPTPAVLSVLLRHCHLYPSQIVSKIITIFLWKEVWLEDESIRDDYVDLTLKLTKDELKFPYEVSFRILGYFILSLASRFTTKLESTTKYCKLGLELIKSSEKPHSYFWIYFHIVLAHSFVQREDRLLPLENIIQLYPKHGFALASLAEIHYAQRNYEKSRSIFLTLVEDPTFGLRATARIAWLDAIEFVLLDDLHPPIESLQPLVKYLEFQTDKERKDFLITASKSRDTLSMLIDNHIQHMDNVTLSWVYFWLGRLEWVFKNYLTACEHWIKSSNLGLPLSLAYIGHYYEYEYDKNHFAPDLEKAKKCYIGAIKRYEPYRKTQPMVIEGLGEGNVLLEAAIPLLDMLSKEMIQDPMNKTVFNQTISLLTTLSNAGIHWALFKMALCRMQSKEYQLAVPSLQNYLRRNPTDIDAWICLSDCYARLGKHVAALKVSEKAIAIDPSNITIQFQIGYIKMKLLNSQEAKSIFQGLILKLKDSTDQESSNVLFLTRHALGRSLLEEMKLVISEGKVNEAYKLFEESKSVVSSLEENVGDNDALFYKLLGDTWSQSFFIRHILSSNSKDKPLHEDCLAFLKKAATVYRKCLNRDKEKSDSHYDVSINYIYQVIVMYERYTNVGSNDDNLRKDILLLLDQSVKSMKDAVSLNPNNALYWTSLGNISTIYLHCVKKVFNKLIPSLEHIPTYSNTQKCFYQGIQLAGEGLLGFCWSSMLLFWKYNNVNKETLNTSIAYAKNVDPLYPLTWTLTYLQKENFQTTKDLEDTLNLLAHALSLSHDESPLILQYGKLFCTHYPLEEAYKKRIDVLNYLRRYILSKPDCLDANNLLGNVLYILGLYSSAETHFHRCVKLIEKQNHPNKSMFYFNYALALEMNGKLDEALSFYNVFEHAISDIGKLRIGLKSNNETKEIMDHIKAPTLASFADIASYHSLTNALYSYSTNTTDSIDISVILKSIDSEYPTSSYTQDVRIKKAKERWILQYISMTLSSGGDIQPLVDLAQRNQSSISYRTWILIQICSLWFQKRDLIATLHLLSQEKADDFIYVCLVSFLLKEYQQLPKPLPEIDLDRYIEDTNLRYKFYQEVSKLRLLPPYCENSETPLEHQCSNALLATPWDPKCWATLCYIHIKQKKPVETTRTLLISAQRSMK